MSDVRVLILFSIRVTFTAFLVLGLSILTTYGVHAIARLEAWSLALLVLFLILCIVVVLTIWRQPQNQQKVAFMVRIVNIRDPKYFAHFLLWVSFISLKKVTSDDVNQGTRVSRFLEMILFVISILPTWLFKTLNMLLSHYYV